ncbi:hypothetical protein V6N13_084473 [Hibiscus sabdariffa]|uniref:Homeobox domain-containing protein n=1 Tax=Hibiscus sabdariffa TaxID=183260 RepID=A0ABR2T160_9ROSI
MDPLAPQLSVPLSLNRGGIRNQNRFGYWKPYSTPGYMVNPPREEIRKIRAQLQEYGQVGDANVFYWFQNRKSRSKPKLRTLQNTKQQQSRSGQNQQITHLAPSSSPEGAKKTTVIDVSDSPSGLVNQTYFHQQPQTELFLNEAFFFPMQQVTTGPGFTQGFAFPDQPVGPCTSLLLSEILNHEAPRKEPEEKMLMQLQLSYSTTNNAPPASVPSHDHHIYGVGELGAVEPGVATLARSSSTMFINDVAFEVAEGPFNVREAFGDDAILINSAGQPVLTNEWGITLQSLQHAGFYYLLRSYQLPFSV